MARLFEDAHTPGTGVRIIPQVNPEMSAEAALQREIAALAEWLAAQGLDLRADEAHADEGSRDRLYWRYGYFAGLKQASTSLRSYP